MQSTSPDDDAPKKRRKRKLPKTVTRTEALQLLEAAEAERHGVRNRLILELMYRAGLRVSEAVSLYPRDIERDGVVKLFDAKGGDGTSYFSQEMVPLLDRWLEERRGYVYPREWYEKPLFVKPNGDPLTSRYIQRLVKRLKERLGIRGIVTPHVFRHSMATEMIEEGFPITEVQRQLRHADIATTSVYLHVRDESLRQKIQRRGSLSFETREEV